MRQVFSNQRNNRLGGAASLTHVLAILVPVCFGLVAHSFLPFLIQLFDGFLVIRKNVDLIFLGKFDVLAEELH